MGSTAENPFVPFDLNFHYVNNSKSIDIKTAKCNESYDVSKLFYKSHSIPN